MKILGIETSCDDTGVAIVEDGRNCLSNIISSQEEMHAKYGGIVPEIASRQHLFSIVPAISSVLENTGMDYDDIDAVAVTNGPGLAGSLLVGVNFAKGIAFAKDDLSGIFPPNFILCSFIYFISSEFSLGL